MRKLIENIIVMALPNIEKKKKIFGNLRERCRGRFPTFRGFQSTKCMEEKLFSTSEYIGKQTLFFSFEGYHSRHSKPPFPNSPPPPPKKNFLGGYYIGKNHFLQNGKINVDFLCVLML